MKAVILAAAVALLASNEPTNAAVYYVDADSGSDSGTGRSAEAAWRTLARAGRVHLSPGDALLLRRGSVWGEALVIASSGTVEAPIRVGAYGSGARPVLDGARLAGDAAVLALAEVHDVVVTDLAIVNSNHHGVSGDDCARVALAGLSVSRSRHHGVLFYDCSAVTMEDTEVFENGLDTADSFDGVRIDGSGQAELWAFLLRQNRIHNNVGGDGWKSANGVFIGHTGANPPTLHGVEITANDVYSNGNPNQNQAGRGITGTFHGEVTVSLNRIHDNASAGLYFGDHGTRVDIAILNNFFTNNALRQFGGFTDATARAEGNTVLVDDGSLTAMGAEIGGNGTWILRRNSFQYTTDSADIFRGFIRINDATLDGRLDSDYNVFYSRGPRRWKRSDGVELNFDQWRQAGYDVHSSNPR